MSTKPTFIPQPEGGYRRSDGGCAVNCIGPEKCAWHKKGSALPEGTIQTVIPAETYNCLHFEGARIIEVGGQIGRLDQKGFHPPTPEGEVVIATHPYFVEHRTGA